MTQKKHQKTQTNIELKGEQIVNPWRDIYHSLLSLSWPKFLASMTLGYILINLIFGVGYFLLGREGLEGLRSKDNLGFLIECFFFSVQTFSTIGYGHISPLSLSANSLICVQAFLGLLSIGMMSGLFFSRFSRPTAKVIFSEIALVTSHLGQKSLILRMANGRMNRIIDATARVTLMQTIQTPEGAAFRQMLDLNLVRQSTQMFFLSWTLVHTIDEKSPLFDKTPEDLKTDDIEIVVSIVGHDETFAQLVHSRHTYKAMNLIFNRYFEDMITRNLTETVVEIDKISLLKN